MVTKNQCASGRLDRCDQALTAAGLSTPDGPFYYLYLLAARGTQPTMSGLMVGIDYESRAAGDVNNGTGVDVFSWTLCATAEYIRATTNTWPEPGGSNIIVWNYIDDCQTSEIAVAGYFYTGVYSPDRFRLTPDELSNDVQVSNCDLQGFDLAAKDLGYVEFSDGAKARGCNPCLVDCSGAVTVAPTTWSRIKTLIGK
ncbi:MAG: hypothetical protein SGI90_10365 [Candidatus Eisenbacteria bacterium]|nr:hypothetical protein [Candidatus Eisenbacteria bacterium]